MNYLLHYDRLIERSRHRAIEGYRERHHVLPRCLGGSDALDNLVDLTPEEHYVAHQLLVKLHPGHAGLAHAAVWMSLQCSSNKAYGWLRRRKAEAMRGTQPSLETRAKISAAGFRRKHSIETRAKMGAAHLGKTHSAETRAKIATTRLGKPTNLVMKMPPLSAEARAKIGAASRGKRRVFSDQHRANIGAASRGRPCSEETRMKISLKNKLVQRARDSSNGRYALQEWVRDQAKVEP